MVMLLKKYVVSWRFGSGGDARNIYPFSDGRQGEIIYISPWGCQSIVVEKHPSYSLILRIAIVESFRSCCFRKLAAEARRDPLRK